MAKNNSIIRKQERREGALNRFSIKADRKDDEKYVQRKEQERNKLKERLGK